MTKTIKLKLLSPHSVDDKQYAPGDVIEVNESTAEWLLGIPGKAELANAPKIKPNNTPRPPTDH